LPFALARVSAALLHTEQQLPAAAEAASAAAADTRCVECHIMLQLPLTSLSSTKHVGLLVLVAPASILMLDA
jgi:hypothetical protein